MFNSDLQALSQRDRAELIVEQILEQALQCFRELDVACKELEAACAKDEANEIELSRRALEHHRVIGMTVVGASIHFSLLAQLKPEVVLVEEAAEVLEPQILAVLGPWVKQLIMIGDTNQLPPQIETFKLKREHHFDVSMMERLILNRLESVQLCKQSRMLPDLRSLLEPIYPDLCDNVKMTTHLKAPECVASPVFFWDCRDPEASSDRSLVNETECDRAVHLAAFFISEGFAPSEITLLAPYAGQVSLLKKQLARKLPELVHTQPKQSKDLPVVSSVDRYQGAENSIVIVSLVRSNPNRKLGFLGWDDGKRRMCVAQSRAKRGLYFIGNAGCLRNAPHWGKLLELLTKAKAIGPGFPQRCPRHPDIRKDAEDAAGLWIKGCIHTAHCLIDDSDDSLCMYARPCDKSHGGGPEDEGRPLKSRRCT
ncbi:ZNFX1 [Symbiodinium necroappetens]|uniref:ZNFX1 protein n=1 Tax=Symbiodinium necroappetens TaxID=1628268 RepID=A0A813A2I6_9DINO|nr:ZNFX1 [Symbiodinium necroappetens]